MVLSETKLSEFSPHFFQGGLPDFEEPYYFNARWYDAGTGRFVTEDPIRDGLLWYSYCSNNPMKFIDPTGLAKEDRLRRRADKAEGKGDDDRAAELRSEADAAEQRVREQQERVEQLPSGYSGINGLSRQGEANQYPESPNINELLTDDTLSDAEKQKLLEEIAQCSKLMNKGAEAFDGLGVSPTGIGVAGKAAGKVAILATVGTMYYDYYNLKTAIQVGDPIQMIDSSASLMTSAVGLINPMAGVVSDIYVEATVQTIEAVVDVICMQKQTRLGLFVH